MIYGEQVRGLKELRKRIVVALDRLHLIWVALAAVFLVSPSAKIAPLVLLVPLSWLVFRWRKRLDSKVDSFPDSFPAVTPIRLSLLLAGIMLLVSLYATYDIRFSFPRVLGLVIGIGIFYSITRASTHEIPWFWMLVGFSLVGTGLSLFALFTTNWFSTKFVFLNAVTSRIPDYSYVVPGGSFHPNIIAGTMLWFIPLALSLCLAVWAKDVQWPKLVSENGPWQRSSLDSRLKWLLRILVPLGSLIMLFVFMLTQSRSAYLALAAVFGLMVFLLISKKLRLTLVVVLVLTMIGGAIFLRQNPSYIEDIAMSFAQESVYYDSALSLDTLDARLEIWSRAIYGLQDFSFTGMGMDNFRNLVPILYPLFNVSPDTDIHHAHNEFLQAGLDLGIPGMVAFLAVYAGVFSMLLQLKQRIDRTGSLSSTGYFGRRTNFVIWVGLMGSLLAHLIFGLVDAVSLGSLPNLVFWVLIALITGIYLKMPAEDRIPSADQGMPDSATEKTQQNSGGDPEAKK